MKLVVHIKSDIYVDIMNIFIIIEKKYWHFSSNTLKSTLKWFFFYILHVYLHYSVNIEIHINYNTLSNMIVHSIKLLHWHIKSTLYTELKTWKLLVYMFHLIIKFWLFLDTLWFNLIFQNIRPLNKYWYFGICVICKEDLKLIHLDLKKGYGV